MDHLAICFQFVLTIYWDFFSFSLFLWPYYFLMLPLYFLYWLISYNSSLCYFNGYFRVIGFRVCILIYHRLSSNNILLILYKDLTIAYFHFSLPGLCTIIAKHCTAVYFINPIMYRYYVCFKQLIVF